MIFYNASKICDNVLKTSYNASKIPFIQSQNTARNSSRKYALSAEELEKK